MAAGRLDRPQRASVTRWQGGRGVAISVSEARLTEGFLVFPRVRKTEPEVTPWLA